MNIKRKLITLELLSLLALSVILITGSLVLSVGEMDTRIEETLRTAVYGFNGDTSYLRNQGENIDITVFEGDTRIDSSIEGVAGTKASKEVTEQVLTRQETYFDSNVSVNGTAYYGYYIPTDNGCCLPESQRTLLQNLSVLPLWYWSALVLPRIWFAP